jgi:hypothetical protein
MDRHAYSAHRETDCRTMNAREAAIIAGRYVVNAAGVGMVISAAMSLVSPRALLAKEYLQERARQAAAEGHWLLCTAFLQACMLI